MVILKTHECDVCRVAFRYRNELEKHRISHTTRFKCEQCGVLVKSAASLLLHKERTCSIDNRSVRFPCPFVSATGEPCPATFAYKTGLTRHTNNHAGLAIKCAQCTKTFAHQQALNAHVRNKHMKTKHVFACVVPGCSSTFAKNCQLSAHVHKEHKTLDDS